MPVEPIIALNNRGARSRDTEEESSSAEAMAFSGAVLAGEISLGEVFANLAKHKWRPGRGWSRRCDKKK